MSRRRRRRWLTSVATRVDDALDEVEAATARQASAHADLVDEISRSTR